MKHLYEIMGPLESEMGMNWRMFTGITNDWSDDSCVHDVRKLKWQLVVKRHLHTSVYLIGYYCMSELQSSSKRKNKELELHRASDGGHRYRNPPTNALSAVTTNHKIFKQGREMSGHLLNP